jgi:hypothetical protein
MLSKTVQQFRPMVGLATRAMASNNQGGAPKKIIVTGAAGQISYSILYRLARYEY